MILNVAAQKKSYQTQDKEGGIKNSMWANLENTSKYYLVRGQKRPGFLWE